MAESALAGRARSTAFPVATPIHKEDRDRRALAAATEGSSESRSFKVADSVSLNNCGLLLPGQYRLSLPQRVSNPEISVATHRKGPFLIHGRYPLQVNMR